MDEGDRAQSRQEEILAEAMERRRAQAAMPAEPGDGICLACKEPIPAGRLKAVPKTRLFRDCTEDKRGR